MKEALTIGLLLPLLAFGQTQPEYKAKRPLIAQQVIKKKIEQGTESHVSGYTSERSANELRMRKDMVAPRERRD